MPSATGQNWEKYQKKFADDEVEEKKITPLSDEYVMSDREYVTRHQSAHTSTEISRY
jgi:26S proteasome regulatory subunit T1